MRPRTIASTLVTGLPTDPVAALVEFGARVKSQLDSLTDHASDIDYAILRAATERYAQVANQQHGFSIRLANANSSNDYERIVIILSQIKSIQKSHLEQIIASEVEEVISIENQINNKETFGIAILSSIDKEKVRFHLNNAKDLIVESSLSDRKKNALLDRIGQALAELDTVGTRTDRFFTLMGDSAFVLGDMAEKAKPFTSEVKEILKIVFRRREDTEGVRLPHKDEQLLLPGESDE